MSTQHEFDPDEREDGAADRSRAKPRLLRKRTLFIGLLVILLPLVLLLGGLGTATGNRILFGLLSDRIESSSGWRIEARSARVGWGPRLILRGLEVTSPEGRLVARSDYLEALVPTSTLKEAPQQITIPEVIAEQLWFDLAALPASSEETSEPADWQLDLQQVTISNATLASQQLESAIELPIGTSPLVFRSYGASGVDLSGAVRVGRITAITTTFDGQLGWEAEGVAPRTAGASGRVTVKADEPLRLEDVVVSADGLELAGGLVCAFGGETAQPCVMEGVGQLRSKGFLLPSHRQGVADVEGELTVEGSLDLNSFLGDLEIRIADLPLSVALEQTLTSLTAASTSQPSSSLQSAQTVRELTSSLILNGVVEYTASRTGDSAVVSGSIDLEAADEPVAVVPRAPPFFSTKLALSGGGVDERGRVDPWQVAWDGELRASDQSLEAILPLLPRDAQRLVVGGDLSALPFAISSNIFYEPRRGGRGDLQLAVGSNCEAGELSCALRLTATDVSFGATDGSPDASTLNAEVVVAVTEFPGDALVDYAVSDPGLRELIESIAVGGDVVDLALDASIRDGRIRSEDLEGNLVWLSQRRFGGAVDQLVANSVNGEPEEVLLTADVASRARPEGSFAAVDLTLRLLPGLEGLRRFEGVLTVPQNLDFLIADLEGQAQISGPIVPLARRTGGLAGASASMVSEMTDALDRFAPDSTLLVDATVEGPISDLAIKHGGSIALLPATYRAEGAEAGASEFVELGVDDLAVNTLIWAGFLGDKFASGSSLSAESGKGRIATGSENFIDLSLSVEALSSSPLPWLIGAYLGEEGRPEWFPPVGSFEVEGALDLSETAVRGQGRLVARNLIVADQPVDRLVLEVVKDPLYRDSLSGPAPDDPNDSKEFLGVDQSEVWQITELSIDTPGTATVMSGTVAEPSLERLPAAVDLKIEAAAARYGVEELVGQISLAGLRGEVVRFRSDRVKTKGEIGSAKIDLPLGALAALDDLEPVLAQFGVRPTEQVIHVDFSLPYVRFQATDEEALEAGPVPEDRAKNFVEFSDFELVADLRPTDLVDSTVQLSAEGLEARYAEYELTSLNPVQVGMTGGRLELDPLRMQPRSLFSAGDYEHLVEFRASAELGSVDSLEGMDQAIRNIDLDLEGPIELALMQRFLSPARAVGVADLVVQLRGPPNALNGTVRLDGVDASIHLLEPYVSRFDDLQLAGKLERGNFVVEDLTARLNQGRVRAQGKVTDNSATFDIDLDAVRYRVDYGLSTQISGDLSLRVPIEDLSGGQEGPQQRGRLAGRISIDRGLARREIDLDSELRNILFAPTTASGAVDPLAALIDLNLDVTTVEGIRVRNNVADLRATWDELRVRGTLATPIITGTVEADPGGIVTAYGQVVRVDRGELRFTGQPGGEPEIELETTSSIQDPSIRRSSTRDLDPFSAGAFGASSSTQQSSSQAFAGGLADYFGAEVGDNLGRAFGGLVNVRPVLVFGETEPSARLIVTREIDENFDIGVSLELRNAEERLYLIDAHGFPIAPTLSAQVFTNEQGNEGATLQQNLELGGPKKTELQVGKVRFQFPELSDQAKDRISELKMRRDLSVDSGDEWYEGAAFDAETDISDSLRDSRFPSPEVRVEVVERGRHRDLNIQIEPGEPVFIDFEGLEPAKVYRAAIRLSYRSDFYREASLREMREQTRKALEAEGWLDVNVQLDISPADLAGGTAERIVLTSAATRKVTLERLQIEGLDTEGALAVENALNARGTRVALAKDDDVAKAKVLSALAGLGWLQAELTSVSMSDDGKTLVLVFDRGRRARISDIRLVGIDDSTATGRDVQTLAGQELLIAPGDPVVERELARAAIQIEDVLRDSGYSEAAVSARSVRLEGEEGTVRDPLVQVQVEAGPLRRITEIKIPDDGSSDPDWIRQQIAVDEGDIYNRSKVRESRTRLMGTGVFSTVSFETLEWGTDSEEDVNLAVLLRERPRWSVAYGLRWETEEGIGVVVDAYDRNFTGRGLQLGARALWTEPRQAARVIFGVPRLLGSAVSLDAFAEVRHTDIDDVESDVAQGTFQLSKPLTDRLSGRTYFRYRIDEEIDRAADDPQLERTKGPIVGAQLVYDVRAHNTLGTGTPSLAGTSGAAAALFRGLEGGLGTFASLDVSTSSQVVSSDFDYVRAFGQVFHARRAFTLGTRDFVWAQSFRLGVIENRGRELPREQRFFAGGEYSVRGYPREGLGPREVVDEEERALGGEAVFIANQELRFPVLDSLGVEGVVFFDTGNVWADSSEVLEELLSAAGLGVRYRSPVGLLRLDIAFPLDRLPGEDSVRYYLGFGHVF